MVRSLIMFIIIPNPLFNWTVRDAPGQENWKYCLKEWRAGLALNLKQPKINFYFISHLATLRAGGLLVLYSTNSTQNRVLIIIYLKYTKILIFSCNWAAAAWSRNLKQKVVASRSVLQCSGIRVESGAKYYPVMPGLFST